MADISKIKIESSTYDIKDVTARNNLANSTKYSTSETLIGKWINNENLYRIVVSATSPTTADTGTNIYNVSSLNINRVIKLEYNLKDTYNEIANGATQLSLFTRVNGNDRQIACTVHNSTYLNKPMYIIIEYTKN